MNQHQLSIEAHYRPEVVERILRVVRHRGFQINHLQMQQPHSHDNINIEMTVTSSRAIELLSVQLNKLMDVASVQVSQQKTQQIRA